MDKYKQYIDNPDYEFISYNKGDKFANGGIQFANGGTGNISAEVEKQENSLGPNGEFTQFNGNSHSQGGIKTDLPTGSMIFSDRLKPMGSKKTFAELNKVNGTNKEDKVLESTKYGSLSKHTAELMKFAKNKTSEILFQEQEALKQAKVEKYAKKMGVTLPNSNTQPPQQNFALGGVQLPMYTNNKNELPMYYDGGKYGEVDPLSLDLKGNPQIQDNYGLYKKEMDFANKYSVKDDPNKDTFNWQNAASQVGMGLLQNAGNIYNLSRYNKPEIEKYQRAQANYLDSTAAIRDANMEARNAEYGIRNASGGNAGTYLSNRIGLNAQNVINKDRIRQQYANANAGIGNQFNMFNTQLAQQEVIANAQNRARTRSGKGEAIANTGVNLASQIRDNKATKMDQNTLQLMMKYYNDPEFQRLMKGNKFVR